MLRLYRSFSGMLEPAGAANEQALAPGCRVVVSWESAGPVVGYNDGEMGVIVQIHDEDETRDYPWCEVKLDSGETVEVPRAALVELPA